jgi:hypothetical protein
MSPALIIRERNNSMILQLVRTIGRALAPAAALLACAAPAMAEKP